VRSWVSTIVLGGVVVASVTLAGPAVSTAQESRAFPGWGIEYQIPPTWVLGQMPGRMHVLSSQEEPGSIFVAPGFYENVADVEKDLEAFATAARLAGEPVEGPTEIELGGYRAVVAVYDGQTRSLEPVRAQVIALFTPYETGVVLLGLAKPDQFGTVQVRVEEMALTIQALPPNIDVETVAALSGTWANYRAGRPPAAPSPDQGTRGIDDLLEFDGVNFVWKSAVYLAAEARGDAEEIPATSRELNRGTYSVVDGKLVLKGLFGQAIVTMALEGDRLQLGPNTYFRRR
jgi:hypothetical protein